MDLPTMLETCKNSKEYESLYNKSMMNTKSYHEFNYRMDQYFAEGCLDKESDIPRKACYQTWAYWRDLNDLDPESKQAELNTSEFENRHQHCLSKVREKFPEWDGVDFTDKAWWEKILFFWKD